MDVQAVMTRSVRFTGLDATVADVARIMADNDCGAVPIVDDDRRVVGIVTDRDVCLAMANARRLPAEIPVDHVMSKTPRLCGPADDLMAALQTMQSERVRRLPVVDADGKLRGILSIDDVVLRVRSAGTRQAPELPPDKLIPILQAIFKRSSARKRALAAS